MIRFASIFAAFAVFSGPILAQTASTGDVYACVEIESDTDRLACYDGAVGRLKAAEESGEVATVSREEVEQVRKDSFGFSIPSLPTLALPKFGSNEDAELKRVETGVAAVRSSANGALLVTLDNGQVWRQIDSKPVRVSRKRLPEKATIKTAALGSFMMKLDKGPLFRVRREK